MHTKHLALLLSMAALLAAPLAAHAADDAAAADAKPVQAAPATPPLQAQPADPKPADAPPAAAAKPATPQPANEQVIIPQVDRRNVKVPRIPSNDIELGLFAGTYATQNFGTSSVRGVRLGYHITEDFFVEGAYGQTKVSDENYRQILPAGIFPQPREKLTYYNLSAGINVLPGEVFLGRNTAKASALYLIGGIGNTAFADQNTQTFNVGFGLRVFFADWAALQLDMRDHIFSIDLLGSRQNTQNLETTLGLTFFF